jgi:hypothetical protein
VRAICFSRKRDAPLGARVEAHPIGERAAESWLPLLQIIRNLHFPYQSRAFFSVWNTYSYASRPVKPAVMRARHKELP